MTAIMTVLVFAGTLALDDRASQGRERTTDALKRYHNLVDAYRRGDDTTVKTLLEWDLKRLEEVISIAQTTADPLAPWPEERFKAAGMLHMDAAILELNADREGFLVYLEMASRLFAKAGPQLQPFTRIWYSVASRMLRHKAKLVEAEFLLERARQRLPGDGVVLYESGVLQEEMATYVAFSTDLGPHPTASSYPSSSRTPSQMPGRSTAVDPVMAQRRFLDSAARWLDASIKADPSITLAPLHLGRVRMLLNQDQRAMKLLQGISASPVDTPTGYLADLFIGAIHERRGRLDQAERVYRQALARLPGNQSAYLALSRVLQRSGRGDESRELLNIVLLEPRRTPLEPWWWYLSDPLAEIRTRINALRAVARK